jgi:putative hydrolase of HD superfamily
MPFLGIIRVFYDVIILFGCFMENLKMILEFLRVAEKLKTVRRKIAISDNSRQESPAEHTWRVALMAMVLHRELRLKLDLLKTLEIILVHDLVEAIADDVWILDKNDVEAVSEKERREQLAAEKIYGMLPVTTGSELRVLWDEYESSGSEEAKFAKALDKIEVIIQRNDLGVEHWERSDIYEVLLHWADEPVADFPPVGELWKLVQEELIRQGKK